MWYAGPRIGKKVYWVQPYRRNGRHYRLVSSKVESYDTYPYSYWVASKPWKKTFYSRRFGWEKHNNHVYWSAIGHAAYLNTEVFETKQLCRLALLDRLRNVHYSRIHF